MSENRKPTHSDDAPHDIVSAVRRFARALVGSAGGSLAESVAREALAMASGDDKTRQDLAERTFAEVVRLNRRRLKSQKLSLAEAEREHGFGLDPERWEGLPALIATMPLDEREALLVVALSQFGYEAAARILDVPYSTVISRLMRARARVDAARAAPARRIGHLRLVK